MGASALLALIIAAGDSAAATGESTPFSLTLQGAASLGTYEAAVNWTVIRLIRSNRLEEDAQRGRRPHLEALTGSSAGSVNALLAAALWCEADDEVENLSVDRNLLRDVWLPIGLDQLLPGDPVRYAPSDGLFASSAFTPVVDTVKNRVFSGKGLRFKPGCRVPVGFTMTRVVPQLRTVSGLRVKSQQTVVPLIFEVDRTGVPRLRRDTGLRSTGMAADTATLADATDASGPYIPCRSGDPGATRVGSLPRGLRSTPGVRVPPGVRGWAARGHPRSVPGTAAGKAAHRPDLFRLQRRPGRPGVQALPEQLHRRRLPGQRTGGAGHRAGRGLCSTPDTPAALGAAHQSHHPTAAGRASACAGASRPGIQRRRGDGQRPGEYRARAAARRGHRLPALEPHHPDAPLSNRLCARRIRLRHFPAGDGAAVGG